MTTHQHRADLRPAHSLTAAGPLPGWLGPDRAVVGPHRPLRLLAWLMVASTLACLVGTAVDDRQLLGLNAWDKPLKFSVSVLIYAVTWSWLIDRLQRFRRLAWWAGTVATLGLVGEMVVIIGQTVRGQASHFNVATPLDITLWSAMATMIAAVWVASLVVCALLFRSPSSDPARVWAIRGGALLSVVGMALGLLMVSPTPAQLASDPMEVVGAHTVGLADGGPGLPVLGWSTVGGDLRIPHFIGMHALQALPILLIVLELLSRRVVVLADPVVRRRLVQVVGAAYAALVGLVTWQALRGQSVVHPDGWTLLAGAALVVATLSTAALALRGRRPA